MLADEEWKLIQSQRQFTTVMATSGILHVMPLFGFIAVAMTLIVTPLIKGKARSQIIQAGFEGLDFTAWGARSRTTYYALSRSVLWQSSQALCIIYDNSRRIDQCD